MGGREKGFNKCSLSNWLLLKKPRLLSSRILTFVQVKVFKCRGRQMRLAVRTGGDRIETRTRTHVQEGRLTLDFDCTGQLQHPRRDHA